MEKEGNNRELLKTGLQSGLSKAFNNFQQVKEELSKNKENKESSVKKKNSYNEMLRFVKKEQVLKEKQEKFMTKRLKTRKIQETVSSQGLFHQEKALVLDIFE